MFFLKKKKIPLQLTQHKLEHTLQTDSNRLRVHIEEFLHCFCCFLVFHMYVWFTHYLVYCFHSTYQYIVVLFDMEVFPFENISELI